MITSSPPTRTNPKDVPKVLVVGLGVPVTEDARRMCVAEGWGFVEASTLHQMWSALALSDPWVVVMPLRVEATSARAVTARIRMRFPHGEVGVVGLIDASAPQIHAEALLAGFDVYLSTASGPAAFQSELRRVFEVVRGRRGRSAPSP